MYPEAIITVRRRTPHGVRGLKLSSSSKDINNDWSHPSRGAWIEMQILGESFGVDMGRTPHGVRGLKSLITLLGAMVSGRTPHGVRGLKCFRGLPCASLLLVAPLTGCVD